MTSLTFINARGTYTVEMAEDLVTCEEVVDTLVTRVLLAAGFHPETVEETLGALPSKMTIQIRDYLAELQRILERDTMRREDCVRIGTLLRDL